MAQERSFSRRSRKRNYYPLKKDQGGLIVEAIPGEQRPLEAEADIQRVMESIERKG